MTVRAKFECVRKEETNEGAQVQFFPVTGGSPENEQFFKWTPAGQIQIGTINKAAAAQFEVGKQYYVDFSPAE